MKNRNTMQRRLVLETVQQLQTHPNAESIYQAVAEKHPQISKATVYRNLKLLAQQGAILHIPLPSDADCYDFNIKPHYHFQCRMCHRVFDVALPYQEQLCSLVQTNQSGVLVEQHQIVFSGICPDCNQKASDLDCEQSKE